ncbi:MAG: nitrous oxide reductase family maturation protein NosD, partial [Candidatus Hodarchaeota archaeon]
LLSCSQITILGNNITGYLEHSIFVSNSYKISVSHNIFDNNRGMDVKTSNYTLISYNDFIFNDYGIHFVECVHSTVLNNIFNYSVAYGALEFYSSINNTVANNFGYNSYALLKGSTDVLFLYDCALNLVVNNSFAGGYYGINLQECLNNIIMDNNLYNNIGGISITDSICSIINNSVAYNTREAIKIDSKPPFFPSDPVYSTLVQTNDFIGNNLTGSSQASASGSNHTFIHNYWSDWTSPDTNADGIVDNAYIISHNSDINDLFPYVSPNHPSSHYLFNFQLLYPLGGKTLSKGGQIQIQWTPANDSLGHSVMYKVYYSETYELWPGITNWVLLAENVNTASYDWDTSTVGEGAYITYDFVTEGPFFWIKVIALCSENPLVQISSNIVQITLTDTLKIDWSGWIFTLPLTLVFLVFLKKRRRK